MSGQKACRALVLFVLAAAALTASGSAPGSPENPWLATASTPRVLPHPTSNGPESRTAALLRREGEAAAPRTRAALLDTGSTGPSWEGVASSALAASGAAGAVGPHGYLELVNGAFGLYDRSGGHVADGTLAALLPTPAAGGHLLSQPQALWDPATSRFYYAFLDLDPNGGPNYVAYGFSKDDAPTGADSFCRYELDYSYMHLPGLPDGDAVYPDSPRLGTTQHFVLIGVNVFDWPDPRGLGASFGADVDWVEKPGPGTACPTGDSLSLEAHNGVLDPSGGDLVSPVPAVQVDPSATGWVVAAPSAATGGSPAQLFALKVVDSDPAGTGDLIPTFPSVSAITVPKFSAPPAAPQPVGPPIDTLEGRLGNAVSATDPTRGGVQAIWTQHTVAGTTGSQVRWYELDPAKRTVLQSGATDSALPAFNGAIAPDRVVASTKLGGSMVLGYDTSSATSPLTVRWASKEGTGAQGGPISVQGADPVAGIACDEVCDWGGAAASADPAADPNAATGSVWLTNAWASGGTPATANWRTQNFAVHVPLTVPTITSFSPASGPVGTQVTINGTRFLGITEVRIGGVATPIDSATATQIKAKVPAGAVTGAVEVSNDGGTASKSTFKVTPKITPWPLAPVQAGEVGVDGTNLNDPGGALKLGSRVLGFTADSSTHSHFTVPDDAVSAPLTFSTSSGSFTTPSNLLVRPTVTDTTPTATAGATVTLTGKTFTGTSAVTFSPAAAASSFKVVSPTSLTAVVPSGAVGGPVTVKNAGGSTPSPSVQIVPKATAISPASGPVGALVTITGTGLDGAATATVGGVPLTDLQHPSATQLKGKIGAGAVSGNAVVTTAGGTSAPPGPAFKVTPTVTSLDKPAYHAEETVTATGTNLDEVTALKIGNVAATLHPPTTSTERAFDVPVGALTGAITVTSPAGTTVTTQLVKVLPTITAVPGHTTTGTSVTIPGTTFAGTKAVKFTAYGGAQPPSVPATFSVSGGVLKATVPSAAVSGPISVENAGGVETSADTFVVDPKVTSVSPSSAGVGDSITLTGSGLFLFGGATFPGVADPVMSFDATSNANTLKLVVPEGATSGTIVVDTIPSTVDASIPFKVAPTIVSFQNPVHVGEDVTVTGKNFAGLLPNGLKLGSLVLTQLNPTPTSVEFVVPPAAATGKLSVTTPFGTDSLDLEVLADVDAVTGAPAAAGQVLTITGRGLNGVKTVQFTGPNGTLVPASFTTSGGLKATVPTGAVSGPIHVTTGAATPGMSAPVVVLPKVSSFTPTSGPSAGPAVVTVNGSGFQPGATLTFTPSLAADALTWVSATKLTAKVPAGATTGKLTVANPDGSAQSGSLFTVTFGVTRITPTSGPVGTQVQIEGLGFNGSSKAFFGAVAATTTFAAGKLTATVPAGAVSGPITVKKGSTVTQSRDTFTVVSLQGPSPDHGPTGTAVTINGTGLTPGATVTLDGTTLDTAVVTPTQVTLTIPDGTLPQAASGEAVIKVGDLAATSPFRVTLSVTGLERTHAQPGAHVTIHGLGFATATGVAFGGATATLTVGQDGTIDAVVPGAAATGKVTVTNETGTAASAGTFTVDPPLIVSIDPAQGAAGTPVTLHGSGLRAGETLTFAGQPVTGWTATGDTLTFTVPDGVVPPADGDGNHDAVVAVAGADTAHPATASFRLLLGDTWVSGDPFAPFGGL